MSITFTPTKGVWETFGYFSVEEWDAGKKDDVANGYIRVANEEPSMNLANSNAHWFFNQMHSGLSLGDGAGEIPVAQLGYLHKRCEEILRLSSDEKLRNYAGWFQRLLTHSMFHGCSIRFG